DLIVTGVQTCALPILVSIESVVAESQVQSYAPGHSPRILQVEAGVPEVVLLGCRRIVGYHFNGRAIVEHLVNPPVNLVDIRVVGKAILKTKLEIVRTVEPTFDPGTTC